MRKSRPEHHPVVVTRGLWLWLLVALALFVSVPSAGAGPLRDYLPAGVAAVPPAGLRAASTSGSARQGLKPDHPAAEVLLRSITAEISRVVVEALFVWPKPANRPLAEERLAIYNIFRAIGTLQGIEYWSASRGTLRTLYVVSHRVEGPAGETRIEDTRLPAIPPAPEILHARQKDLSFGDNRYRIELQAGNRHVACLSTNLTPIAYGILPVASPGEIRAGMLAINADEAVLFYVVTVADPPPFPGLRNKLEVSFGNRAAALHAWFAEQATGAWQEP